MNPPRSHELLSRRSSRLLVVDVQEKLAAAMSSDTQQDLFESCRFLCQGAQILQVPVTLTEQYPQGLGPTVASLIEFTETRHAKKRFSALECTGWPTAAEAIDDRFQIVVAGMETHVCVQQTVLDLLAAGYQTYVAVDALAARNQLDHEIAIQRMANSGAILTTAESVIFEWCETADAAEFKQISALIKSRAT
ncbi:isochorismatase family protein [Schlesneria paludicola]|uniref:isochorismatase family protein n=1 Tax=Schlesneria paludicola TaxID=360056 RepID=UPI00029A6102|nr:isochorismatase family protein [Schlesneria paludicola]